MKKVLYLIALSIVTYSCGNQGKMSTYVPRTINATEKFNEPNDQPTSPLVIEKYEGDKSADAKEVFQVKFKDTLVNIQLSGSDSSQSGDKFAFADFVNTQKTAMLVQLADNSGMTAPFFIIAVNEGVLDVVSLYRPSNGKNDKQYTKGSVRIGRNGYLINNDFFVANVNAKVYLIKRQNPEERIQGEFLSNSPDRTTLAFYTPESRSVYQVNYVANEAIDVSVNKEAGDDIYRYVQKNFTWQPNEAGIYYFKPSKGDKIVDISSFK